MPDAVQNTIVIGAGFSGLSAACCLAAAGEKVLVLEKHEQPGGRARRLQMDGFSFDMGPSWYWMPDVFDSFFARFGKKTSDYYELKRLDPSYRIYGKQTVRDIPAEYNSLLALFESIEPGSALQLERYLAGAAFKYKLGMERLVYKPCRSILEFAGADVLKGIAKLQVFTSARKHISKYFRHPDLQELLSFPLLFLGALPENTPALYSLMNYADMKLGTWYPMGGIYKVVEAMYQLAEELGVAFRFGENVRQIDCREGKARAVLTDNASFEAEAVVASADYQFVEQQLLPKHLRSYSPAYWNSRVMAPSCLIFYLGVQRNIPGLEHHMLFFDADFNQHAQALYETRSWPDEPLFYVCCPSVTDHTVAPQGAENLFVLIPVASGIEDTAEIRERYYNLVMERMEHRFGMSLREHVVVNRSYACSDFLNDYNAFRGNAYGLANTLRQTALLKPAMKSRKVENLFYAGQLTVPGPGVPPAIISGQVAATEVLKYRSKKEPKHTERA